MPPPGPRLGGSKKRGPEGRGEERTGEERGEKRRGQERREERRGEALYTLTPDRPPTGGPSMLILKTAKMSM